MELEGKHVVVAGMERSGLAACALLVARGARVLATDLRPLAELPRAAELLPALAVPFAVQTPEVFAGAGLIVLSPGVPADLPPLADARARGVPVWGEVELAGRFLRGPNIGITGSNGKTTTTALTGHLLAQAGIPGRVGGNIGEPVCALVDSSRPDQWNVLELSSFQLETIETFRCQLGACLNVTPDHLDRHGTFAAYAAAKARLFATQQAEDVAVLNAADETCRAYASLTPGRTCWFQSAPAHAGAWLENGVLWIEGRRLMAAREIPLRGGHNVENVLAAALLASLAGAPSEAIAAGVRSFRAVEHRLEFVRRVRGVDYFNDSKATNVDAARKSIDAFDGGLWIILGGKDKGGDYTPLGEPLRRKAKAALLIGAASAKIAAQLEPYTALLETGTLAEAVRVAAASAAPGDTVLLAPACASFDQFENFEHRGRVFKELVYALEED